RAAFPLVTDVVVDAHRSSGGRGRVRNEASAAQGASRRSRGFHGLIHQHGRGRKLQPENNGVPGACDWAFPNGQQHDQRSGWHESLSISRRWLKKLRALALTTSG